MKTILLLYCLAMALFAPVALAQPAGDEALALVSNELKPDVRVVVDISGSMKHNDPNYLRRPALELLVQLLPDGSRAGVWTFGQWVNNLVASDKVDADWRAYASAQAEKISSVALRTNIPLALEKAVSDAGQVEPGYGIHLLLLTDGMVDVSASPEENSLARQRIIAEILPKLKEAGVTIHTIALSKNADRELMELLAAQTNGLAATAETAEDLSRIFVQAFDAAVPAEQLPLEDNTFNVDSSIEEFTTLVFKKAGAAGVVLHSPDGKTYSLEQHSDTTKWFRQNNHELMTVTSPLAGAWRIDADLEPGSRVTVISHLNLAVAPLTKNNVIGDSVAVVAALKEEGLTIVQPEFLNLVDVSATITRRDDQQQWLVSLSDSDPIPSDGLFTTRLNAFEKAGVYDVVIGANSKTFRRQQAQTVAVRDPYEITTSSSNDRAPRHTVTLYARSTGLDGVEVDVTAYVKGPDSLVMTLPAELLSERRWQLELPVIEQTGTIEVVFGLAGTLPNGDTLADRTQTLMIDHRVAGQQVVAPVEEGAIAEQSARLPEVEAQAVPELKALSEVETLSDVETAAETETETVSDVEAITESEAKPALADEIKLPAVSVTAAASDGDSNIFWYIGIAGAQLLVMLLIYFVYKTVAGNRLKSAVLSDEEEHDRTATTVEEAPGVTSKDELAVEPVEAEMDAELAMNVGDDAIDDQQVSQLDPVSNNGQDTESSESDLDLDLGVDFVVDIEGEQFDDSDSAMGEDNTVAVADAEPDRSADSLGLELEDAFDLPDDVVDMDSGPVDSDQEKEKNN